MFLVCVYVFEKTKKDEYSIMINNVLPNSSSFNVFTSLMYHHIVSKI